MVYQILVWKQENFYWRLTVAKNVYIFGSKSKKMLFVMGHHPTCMLNLIY